MASPTDRFQQTISYATLTGRDSNGKPTLSAVSTAAARVEPARKFMRDARGNETVASFKVYTAAAVGMNHRIWFPGEDTSDLNKARRPIAVDEHVDGAGSTIFRTVWF